MASAESGSAFGIVRDQGGEVLIDHAFETGAVAVERNRAGGGVDAGNKVARDRRGGEDRGDTGCDEGRAHRALILFQNARPCIPVYQPCGSDHREGSHREFEFEQPDVVDLGGGNDGADDREQGDAPSRDRARLCLPLSRNFRTCRNRAENPRSPSAIRGSDKPRASCRRTGSAINRTDASAPNTRIETYGVAQRG